MSHPHHRPGGTDAWLQAPPGTSTSSHSTRTPTSQPATPPTPPPRHGCVAGRIRPFCYRDDVSYVAVFSLPATEARDEALLAMARRESGESELTLAQAEVWWADECDRLGIENRWLST